MIHSHMTHCEDSLELEKRSNRTGVLSSAKSGELKNVKFKNAETIYFIEIESFSFESLIATHMVIKILRPLLADLFRPSNEYF